MVLYPRCKENLIAEYVSQDQRWAPCCWLGVEPLASELKVYLGELADDFDLTKKDLRSVNESPAMKKIEASWATGEFAPCLRFCNKKAVHGSQNEKKHFHLKKLRSQ